MNNDAILASISKIHAYRYAKEKQRGVLTTNGGFSTTDPTLLQVPCTIQCVFTPRTFVSRQCVFDTSGSNVSPRIDILDTGNISIYYGGTAKSFAGEIGRQYNVTFVVSETEQSAYVDGELLGSVTYTTTPFLIYVLGGLSSKLTNKFQGDYLLHRHFNYAMSADEVKALHNNGNPLGHVVPKLYKQFGPSIEPASDTYEFNKDDTINSKRVTPNTNYQSKHAYRIDYVVDEWDYQPTAYGNIGFIPIQGASILGGNVVLNTLDRAKLGEQQSFIAFLGPNYGPAIYLYGGEDRDDTTARHLKVTIKGITPVGCIAEYVAPNLVANVVRSQIANIISENSYFWDNVTIGAPRLDIRTNPGIKPGFTYKVNLTVSNFVEGEPYLYAGSKVNITAADGTYDLVITPSGEYDYISVYGGINTQTKNLKITVNSVTLISVASTWLDSAKQLPWSDKYLPPLLQSKGGYDMVANGSPEVLFNE